jgi:hypothetical protein
MTGYKSKRDAALDKLAVTDLDGHVVRDVRKPKKAAAQAKLQCQCSMTTKLVGSGCQYCNPEYMDDHIPDAKNMVAQPAQRKPLTKKQILHFVDTHIGEPSLSYRLDISDWLLFVRAIEAAHGIKENT